MRRGVLLLSALWLALAAAPGAIAAKPTTDFYPALPDYVHDDCGFPVLVHSIGPTLITTFSDLDGNVVKVIAIFPGNKQVLTNLETGTSVTIPTTGPLIIRLNADGSGSSKSVGPWTFTIGHPITGEPGFFFTRGQVHFTFDAEGVTTSVKVFGHVVDVCAQLAA